MTMGIYPENVVQKSTYFSANTFSDILKQPTLTFLLLLLLATTLSAQEFDIRSFEAIPNDLSARKEVRRTVNDEPCALIKVVTNIKGMQFQSNIGIVDVEHQTDGYWLYIAPRERRIKLMAAGYLSRDVPIPEPAEELAVYEMVVAATGTGARGQNSELISVTFRLNEDNVFIRSGSNAPVSATGRSAVFYVAEGMHRFTFSKNGFDEEILELDVRETTVRDVDLKPGEGSSTMSLSGFVVITSEPPGAEVFLNDQRVGTTPYQGRHVPGAYNMALRSYLYYDHNESFTLDQGATYQLPEIKLDPQFGYVSISTIPADAEVLINDKSVGNAPINRRQLGSGYHSIKVRKSLYHENSESFTLEDAEEKNLTIELKPAFGSLKITSEPSGAEVFIDEVSVGTTPYVNDKQLSGTYNVRVEKDLYAPARYAITVNDEEESEKFFALTANFGTLTVESPGAEIFIDGQSAGSDYISQQLAPGNYKV
ncbi:MAG: PEGA domain-containing protein, partial [Cryomorphaceae bacterium]